RSGHEEGRAGAHRLRADGRRASRDSQMDAHSWSNAMKIGRATENYEAWLGRHLRLIHADLENKHKQMRSAPFPFLRATYYRSAQVWTLVCGPAARDPRVLSVGDLHVENFGTWRDIEGRLIWGINDFDEAWPLPYTNDLIRLATSALLAQMNCDA